MGTVILWVVVYTFFVVFPFKLAAGWLGADRADWVSCFIAVLIAGVLGGGVSGLMDGGLTMAFFGNTLGILSLAIVGLVSGLTNRFVLGTTFIRGVMISVIGALLIPGVVFVALVTGSKILQA